MSVTPPVKAILVKSHLARAKVWNGDRFSFVSTAGAFLEWIEGRTLPGAAALGAQ